MAKQHQQQQQHTTEQKQTRKKNNKRTSLKKIAIVIDRSIDLSITQLEAQAAPSNQHETKRNNVVAITPHAQLIVGYFGLAIDLPAHHPK